MGRQADVAFSVGPLWLLDRPLHRLSAFRADPARQSPDRGTYDRWTRRQRAGRSRVALGVWVCGCCVRVGESLTGAVTPLLLLPERDDIRHANPEPLQLLSGAAGAAGPCTAAAARRTIARLCRGARPSSFSLRSRDRGAPGDLVRRQRRRPDRRPLTRWELLASSAMAAGTSTTPSLVLRRTGRGRSTSGRASRTAHLLLADLAPPVRRPERAVDRHVRRRRVGIATTTAAGCRGPGEARAFAIPWCSTCVAFFDQSMKPRSSGRVLDFIGAEAAGSSTGPAPSCPPRASPSSSAGGERWPPPRERDAAAVASVAAAEIAAVTGRPGGGGCVRAWTNRRGLPACASDRLPGGHQSHRRG